MAMFFYAAPGKGELRAKFERHAQEGHKLMLAIEDVANDELIVEARQFTHVVDRHEDIVPLLQRLHATTYAPDYRLCAVFDLTRDFEAQKTAAYDLDQALPPATRALLDQHGRLSKDMPRITPY